jgi:hypothetical protein
MISFVSTIEVCRVTKSVFGKCVRSKLTHLFTVLIRVANVDVFSENRKLLGFCEKECVNHLVSR